MAGPGPHHPVHLHPVSVALSRGERSHTDVPCQRKAQSLLQILSNSSWRLDVVFRQSLILCERSIR